MEELDFKKRIEDFDEMLSKLGEIPPRYEQLQKDINVFRDAVKISLEKAALDCAESKTELDSKILKNKEWADRRTDDVLSDLSTKLINESNARNSQIASVEKKLDEAISSERDSRDAAVLALNNKLKKTWLIFGIISFLAFAGILLVYIFSK